MSKSILVEDARFPGGSKEEIEKDYDVFVQVFDDGSFEVSGEDINVDAFLEDYAIVPPINIDYDEEEN